MAVLFIDIIFMCGLILFLIGGVFFILRQRVFSRTFQNFKKLLKYSSKTESYVEKIYGNSNQYPSAERNFGIPIFILTIGILCISVSALFALV